MKKIIASIGLLFMVSNGLSRDVIKNSIRRRNQLTFFLFLLIIILAFFKVYLNKTTIYILSGLEFITLILLLISIFKIASKRK
jgi:hypothetical protein